MCKVISHRLLSFFTVIGWLLSEIQAISGPCPGNPLNCVCDDSNRNYACQGYKSIPQDLPTDALVLYFKEMPMRTLKRNSFVRYPNLTQIFIRNSSLEEIEPGAFSGIRDLAHLYLESNKQSRLHPDVFEEVPNLKRLDFYDNEFVDYPSESFYPLTSLKQLSFRRNMLTKDLPPAFKVFAKTLTHLDLSENNYTGIEKRFFEPLADSVLTHFIFKNMTDTVVFKKHALALLTSLKRINFSLLNTYQKCPARASRIFAGLPDSIQVLELTIWQTERRMLDTCRYTPKVFLNLYSPNRNITHMFFNFSDSAFGETIRVGLFNNTPNLEVLILTGCRITRFDRGALANLTNLRILGLKENPLFNRDPWYVANMRSVEFLDLDSTNMGRGNYVNPNFTLTYWYKESFPSLTRIHANNNFFFSLPFAFDNEEFYDHPYTSLRVLAITDNQLTSVDYRVFDLFPNLEYFILMYNNIDTLHTQRKRNASLPLLSLDMSSNSIGNASLVLEYRHFQHFVNLRRLYMGSNKIKVIEENSFRDLRKLEWMYLNNNNIEEIPLRLFEMQSCLLMLNLSKNDIRSVSSQHFAGLTSLRELHLASNELSHFDSAVMAVFSNLQAINLQYSPFDCTCELMGCLAGMRQNKTRYHNIQTYRCHSPAELNSVKLLMYNPTNFECVIDPPLRLFLCIFIACASVGGISVSAYRNRWFISKFGIVFQALLKGESEVELIPRYLYDCYVLYNTAFTGPDMNWVESTLLPNIGYKEWMTDSDGDRDGEKTNQVYEVGETFKFFIESRHIPPQASIMESSLYAARNSRQFIIVASKSYVESRHDVQHQRTIAWTEILQEHGPDRVLLIQRPDLSYGQLMDSSLNCFLDGYVIAMSDFQGDENRAWNKIKRFLRRPRSDTIHLRERN